MYKTMRQDGGCVGGKCRIDTVKYRPTVINLFGGPGTGKSTFAAKLFAEMKCKGMNCELVTEYAKDLVWRGMYGVMHDELYVFGKQQHRMRMVAQHVDYIITDSPLLLPIIYDDDKDLTFRALVFSVFNNYNNVNFMLRRFKPYMGVGRTQTEDEARDLDTTIEDLLITTHTPYSVIENASITSYDDIVKYIGVTTE